MQKDYTRIGGWLLFFTLSSMFAVVTNLFTAIRLVQGGYMLLGILIFAVVAIGIILLVQIFRRDDTARYWLIGQGALVLIGNLYSLYLANWDTVTAVLTFVSVAECVLWVLYFTKSQRVAVYMHPDRYVRMQPQQPQYGQQQYGQPQYGQQPYGVQNQPYGMPPAPQPPMPPMATAQAETATAGCPHCGAAITQGARFCGSCGRALT